MRFEVLPDTLRKSVRIDCNKASRTISFDAPLDTRPASWDPDPSSLKDGRALGSLPCSVLVRAADGDDSTGSLTFLPAFTVEDLWIKGPDSLVLNLLFPSGAFDELWQAVSNSQHVVIGGRVDGLPRKYPYLPTPSEYVWDVEPEDNRTKSVPETWFTVLQTATERPCAEPSLKLARAREDESPRHYADKARAHLKEKYESSSQMYRVCSRAIDQAEQEATRRHLSGWPAEDLITQTTELVDSVYAAVRDYGADERKPGEIWAHKDVATFYKKGRQALGQWAVDKRELARAARGLIERPWLRLDVLELAIVDALTFDEIFEYGETLKSTPATLSQIWAYEKSGGNLRRMHWERIKFGSIWWLIRWGAVAAGMWFTWNYVNDHRYESWSGLGILAAALVVLIWLFIGFPVGRSEKRRAALTRFRLLLNMLDAYATMRSAALTSPYQIRAALLSAQEKGAVWESAGLALLDRASMRDPPVWMQ